MKYACAFFLNSRPSNRPASETTHHLCLAGDSPDRSMTMAPLPLAAANFYA